MSIKTVADLKKVLDTFPDDMIVQGWNDECSRFHELNPEVWDASPVHIKDGRDEYDGFVDAFTMECKENPSPEDVGGYDTWGHLTRIGQDTKVLKI
jgi:hypothetical protein